MKTQYDEQAEKFLSENNLKMRITLSDSKQAAWEPSGHHYRVTISKKKPMYRLYEEIAENPNPIYRLTFDFWGSLNDMQKGKAPTAYDVLACISSEVSAPETFADYCAEFGDSEDSIKALQTFRRLDRFAKRLRAFFTPEEIEQLQEIA